MKYGVCQNCGATGIIEKHHIFFRSKAKALVDCKLNHIDLCQDCHRGTYGVHGPHGHKLDIKLKRQAQKKIFNKIRLDKANVFEDKTSSCEIAEILEVPFIEINSVIKNVKHEWGRVDVEDAVRALQGGKLY